MHSDRSPSVCKTAFTNLLYTLTADITKLVYARHTADLINLVQEDYTCQSQTDSNDAYQYCCSVACLCLSVGYN